MRLVPVLVPLALAVSGCEGCAIPFSTSSDGVIRLALHSPGSDCIDAGTETFDNGTPDDTSDDSTVSWNHNAAANTCNLTSTWSGTLLGMATVREDVEKSVADAGLTGQSLSIEVQTVTPTIKSVALVDDLDGDNDPDVTATLEAVVQKYAGCVGLEDGCDIADAATGMLRVTTDGGSVTAPASTVNDPAALVAAANAAIAGEVNVNGVGAAFTEAAMVDDGTGTFVVPAELQALTNPTLVITVGFEVAGEVIVSP